MLTGAEYSQRLGGEDSREQVPPVTVSREAEGDQANLRPRGSRNHLGS